MDEADRTLLERIEERLAGIVDLDLGVSLASVGMVSVSSLTDTPSGAVVSVTVSLTTARCPSVARFRREIVERVGTLDGVRAVEVHFDELDAVGRDRVMRAARTAAQERASATSLPSGASVWAIGSGKGGVGKSTLTVGVALALARRGRSVGIIDTDVTGHSLGQLLGSTERATGMHDGERAWIRPVTISHHTGSIHAVGVGQIVEDPDRALLWQGSTVGRAVTHFLCDVSWPVGVDVVLIDLPPGTSDAPLHLARYCPSAQLVVVTLPSALSSSVAGRVGDLARRSNLHVAGVVENSSYMEIDGRRISPFGSGGGVALARALEVPVIARLPHCVTLAEATGVEAYDPAYLAALEPILERLDVAGCANRLLRRLERTEPPSDAH